MANASFYILPSRSTPARYLYACKLIEKAYRLGQFCYVYTDSQQQSQQLDDLLWSFRKGSFIPHQVYNDTVPEFEQTVLIGDQAAPENWQKLIINLSTQYPDFLTETTRVLEILDDNDAVKQAGRQRFRQYKKDGLETTSTQV